MVISILSALEDCDAMDFTLSNAQQRIVAKATQVAMECLEPRAAHYDETASHPVESWGDLWKNGLLAMAVPKEHGGLGLDMPTYVMVIEKLAQGCTNTAMTVHMHSVVQRYIEALATANQKARFYLDVVEQGKLFGSWGSEPGRHGGSGTVQTIIAPVDGGYVINGQKHFCTMAGAAHRYMVHCNMKNMEGSHSVLMALVPHNALGLHVTGTWDTLGMRGTVSPSVSFQDCFVEKDAVLGEPGRAEKIGVGQGFGLGYAAIYIGAAQRALDYIIKYSQTQQFDPDPGPMSRSLSVQRGVAEMTLALEGARLVLYLSAGRWEGKGPIERAILAARAKYLATEAALMVTSRALQTAGGRVAHKRYPLERLYRDVRTSTLMPPGVDRCLEIVGKRDLGLEDDLLMLRHSS